jgi:putative DNA primase/helicase
MADGIVQEPLFSAARRKIDRRFIEDTFRCRGSYWEGDNFHCVNPSRADGKIGSFSIRDDGMYYDFATGSGGDIFDLLAAVRGVSPASIAMDIVGRQAQEGRKEEEKPRQIKPDWKPFEELPAFLDPQPTYVTAYPAKNNGKEQMFLVVRRDKEDGKEIFPMYYTGGSWIKGLPPSLGKIRPLLPFDASKTVLIVEGEKCQSIASRALDNYSVTTWHGGSGAASRIDIDCLDGADVILWPDNDEPGAMAMFDLAARLVQVNCSVRIVSNPKGAPKGWDIGDCLSRDGGLREAIDLLEVSRPMTSVELGIEAPPTAKVVVRNPTDMGNAERFLDRYGEVVRYNSDKKKWCLWSMGRWSDRDQSIITPMVKETIRSLSEDPMLVDFALECESRSKVMAMIELASREPAVSVHETDFDANPMILNCPNCVVDLKTGDLMEHDPDLMCSMVTNVEYDARAKCPQFMKFLSEISLGRPDITGFLQKWFGYSLTGDVSAQTFCIFYGNGANGKSTLVEIMSKVLGDYAQTAPPDTFVQKISNGIPNDVASLRGARLVLTTETDANAKLAEGKVKNMTGGDIVVARFLHGEFFEFMPTWKIVISTNHRPKISGADYGIWRRVILIPFDFVAIGASLDCNLPSKLWQEKEGILAWAVEGAKMWAAEGMGREGLKVPQILIAETQGYREDEDVIGRFVRGKCVTVGHDPLERSADRILSGATELYQAFIAWAEEDGERYASRMTQTAFGRAMRERGFPSFNGRSGLKEYKGIQLNRATAIPSEQENRYGD